MKRSLTLCSIIAFILAIALVPSSFAVTNLLTNPGFEDAGGSYNGWFTFGSGPNISTPATDNIARTGIAAAKIFGEFTNCPGLPQFDVGGFGQLFTPTAGNVYTFEGFTYIDSGDPLTGTDVCVSNRLLAQIAYFDAPSGGAVIATQEVIVGDASFPLDTWVEFSVTSAPAPVNAMRVEALFLFLQPACDMGAVYVDDVVFCEDTPTPLPNLLANPSFDTSLIGWTTFGNVFHDGRREFLFTPTGSAKLFGTFSMGNDSGMFQSFAASQGQLWRFDGNSLTTCVEDVINGANPNQAIAEIVFRDGGGANIGGVSQVIRDATSPLGTWEHFTLFAVAPALTVAAECFILFSQPDGLSTGAVWVDDISFATAVTTGIGDAPKPQQAELYQNVPNPFNPTTRISFDLLESGNVTLSIYDVAGRHIVTLLNEQRSAGPNNVTWNGRDAAGATAATGVYYYVLETATTRISKSMVLLK